MIHSLRQHSIRLLLFLGAVAVIGCSVLCTENDIASKEQQLESLEVQVANKYLGGGALPESGRAAAAASSAAAHRILSLTAGPPSPFPKFIEIPNGSTGQFIAQVTVGNSSPSGVTTGQTAGGLRYVQPGYHANEGRTLILGASPDGSGGYTSYVCDPFGVLISSSTAFPNTARLQLRIEQTTTDLLFRARPETSPGGMPAPWTDIYTVNTAPDPALFYISVGMVGAAKGANFFFYDFAIDGEAIGGRSAYAVIALLRDSIESLKLAKTKLDTATPDYNGALADLDTARTAMANSFDAIQQAMLDRTLQSRAAANLGLKTLQTLPAEYATVRTAVNSLDPLKVKAQLKRLQKIILLEHGVMANMLGWKAPPYAAIPEDLFSLRIPAG